MMRQTEQQWKELREKTGVRDSVAEKREAERERKVDLEILLAVGTVQDRQAAEVQPVETKPVIPKKKPGLAGKILTAIWLAILRWWHAPRERRQYTPPRRSAKGTRTASRSTAPKRKRGFMEDVPDFGRDFDGPDFDSPFGDGPRW